MKNRISIIVALILTLCMGTASLAACSSENKEKTLYIEMNNAGYGIRWIDPLIEIFEKEHPGITVKKTDIVKGSGTIMDKVDSGSTHLDLVMVEQDFHHRMKAVEAKNGKRYEVQYADLSDIYNEKVPGEDIYLKDKMLEENLELVTTYDADGRARQYAFPWMKSFCSIVVNKDVIPATGEWKEGTDFSKLPNTTQEFFAYMDALPSDITPTIHSLPSDSYWDIVFPIWAYQYYGTETMSKFWRGYHPDNPDIEELRYSADIMSNDGIIEALMVLQKIVDLDNGYSKSDDQSLIFTQVQNKFLETENKVLFMPNGLWLEREMSANYDLSEVNVEFMKMPVVSALGSRLGITDGELSAVIDWVDGGKTGNTPAINSAKGYTEKEVLSAVEDARMMNIANANFTAVIPAYSTKIDLAKEFLQLMATDRGMEAMLKECGASTPFKYSVEKLTMLKSKGTLSRFTYSGNKLGAEGKFTYGYKDPLFGKNQLSMFSQVSSPTASFASPDAPKTVAQVCEEFINFMSAKWSSYLRTAGISR